MVDEPLGISVFHIIAHSVREGFGILFLGGCRNISVQCTVTVEKIGFQVTQDKKVSLPEIEMVGLL